MFICPGKVELDVKVCTKLYETYFSVDLDSVYMTESGQLIYELDKVDVEERNIWQLVIIIHFIDNSHQTFETKPFRLRTKPRPAKKEPQTTGILISWRYMELTF